MLWSCFSENTCCVFCQSRNTLYQHVCISIWHALQKQHCNATKEAMILIPKEVCKKKLHMQVLNVICNEFPRHLWKKKKKEKDAYGLRSSSNKHFENSSFLRRWKKKKDQNSLSVQGESKLIPLDTDTIVSWETWEAVVIWERLASCFGKLSINWVRKHANLEQGDNRNWGLRCKTGNGLKICSATPAKFVFCNSAKLN